MVLPTNHQPQQPILASDINAMATEVNAATAFVTAAPKTYYTKDQIDALLAALSGSTAPAGGTDPTPTSPFKPRDVLNIGTNAGKNHFSVQTAPTGAASYETHTQAEIIQGYEQQPYFYVDTDASGVERVYFQARMDAPTTSGTTYARSELRELDLTGANMAFDASTDTHRMLGTTRIAHLSPVKPEVVIAQMHDGNRDRIAIRTQADTAGVNKLSIRIAGSVNAPGWQDDIAYAVGREFTWKIEGINGTWRVSIDGTVVVTATFSQLQSTSTAWYFKAGCYNQSNETIDAATEYDQVALRQLQHWHTGWPANLPFPTLA
jgi:hypothetical protein